MAKMFLVIDNGKNYCDGYWCKTRLFNSEEKARQVYLQTVKDEQDRFDYYDYKIEKNSSDTKTVIAVPNDFDLYHCTIELQELTPED